MPITNELSLEQIFQATAAQKGMIDPNESGGRLASEILRRAVREGVSDIHFDPHGASVFVRFRIDGQLVDQISYPKDAFPIVARLRVMASFPPKAASSYTAEDGRFEFAIDGRPVQFRASAFPTTHGDKLVLRVLDLGQGSVSLDRLGFAPDVLTQIQQVLRSPSGIFFVAGLTGSGKSTTLCSMLAALSRPEIHIMTLEDPVEYEIQRVNHAQINPKAGFTFAEGLRSMLRQDPNVIMLGEVRDLETAEIAMRAALTGHLIFTTIHATTAIGVVNRLINMGIEPYVVTHALIGALAQRLARRICPRCAELAPPDPRAVEAWLKTVDPSSRKAIEDLLQKPGAKFSRGKGCGDCRLTGFKGRVGVAELLLIDDVLRTMIFNKANIVELRQTVAHAGMKPLLVDAVEKAWQGLITLEEAATISF